MTGLGTIINVAAVLLGSMLGLAIKGGLPQRFEHTVTQAVGLSTLFIGLSGALEKMLTLLDGTLASQDIMVMVVCLVTGAVIGELINIEAKLERAGSFCKQKLLAGRAGHSAEHFVEGFVTSTLLFCVGAMTIVGSLQDGLNHNYTLLFTKSIMDGVMAIILTSSLGIGVAFSILPLALYQGSITLLAGWIRPFLTDLMIGRMSLVGSILIFGLGINLLFGKKIKVGNLLPAMFLPIIACLLSF